MRSWITILKVYIIQWKIVRHSINPISWVPPIKISASVHRFSNKIPARCRIFSQVTILCNFIFVYYSSRGRTKPETCWSIWACNINAASKINCNQRIRSSYPNSQCFYWLNYLWLMLLYLLGLCMKLLHLFLLYLSLTVSHMLCIIRPPGRQ